MKKCELCDSVAKMYCGSDQANLCWECDIKVHGANFLVAKHLRTLLCHVCQSPTPWNGSGLKLGPTVSICDNCADHGSISVGRNRSLLLRNSEILTDISSQELRRNAGNDEQEEDEDEDEDGGNDTEEDQDEDEVGGNDTEEDLDEDDEENQVVPWSCSEECLSESVSKSNRNPRQ